MGVTIVSATRLDEASFAAQSLLGRSLATTFRGFPITTRIYHENTRALADCYNDAVDRAASDDELLVFVHDDVLIADFFWLQHLTGGLSQFELVGVAGNKRRVLNQPAWLFIDRNFTWDHPSNLSGSVGHGETLPCALSVYGPPMQRCKLLDGLFLATRKGTLLRNGIRFDPAFKFHFYDMDICRQCDDKGVSMGTIPLSLVHKSEGAFGTPAWTDACRDYLTKWRG